MLPASFSRIAYEFIALPPPFSDEVVQGIGFRPEHYRLFQGRFEESVAALTPWMHAMIPCMAGLPRRAQNAIAGYQSNDYKNVWEIYENSGFPLNGPLNEAFSLAEPLPEGTIIFEGQGRNERDMVDQYLFPDKRILRKRPTSASWHPNAALDFVGAYTDALGALCIYRIASDNVRALPLELRPDIATQVRAEHEILLQPGIEVVVRDVRTTRELLRSSINRVAETDHNTPSMRLVYCDVYGRQLSSEPQRGPEGV